MMHEITKLSKSLCGRERLSLCGIQRREWAIWCSRTTATFILVLLRRHFSMFTLSTSDSTVIVKASMLLKEALCETWPRRYFLPNLCPRTGKWNFYKSTILLRYVFTHSISDYSPLNICTDIIKAWMTDFTIIWNRKTGYIWHFAYH